MADSEGLIIVVSIGVVEGSTGIDVIVGADPLGVFVGAGVGVIVSVLVLYFTICEPIRTKTNIVNAMIIAFFINISLRKEGHLPYC